MITALLLLTALLHTHIQKVVYSDDDVSYLVVNILRAVRESIASLDLPF